MKNLLLLALLCCTTIHTAFAQVSAPFIAFSANEFIHPAIDTTITDISNNTLGNIVVHTTAGKKKYSTSKVWGYRTKDGNSYRVYKTDVYTIKHAGDLTIYTKTIQNGLCAPIESYYFSKGLDGKIYDLELGPIRKAFEETNPKFVALVKKNIHSWDLYKKYDYKTHTYAIVDLYNQSLQP